MGGENISFEKYVDKLEEHIDQRFKDADKALDKAFEAMDAKLSQRNTEMNEKFLTAKDLEKPCKDIEDLKTFRAVLDAKASQRAVNFAIGFSMADLLLEVAWIASNLLHK